MQIDPRRQQAAVESQQAQRAPLDGLDGPCPPAGSAHEHVCSATSASQRSGAGPDARNAVGMARMARAPLDPNVTSFQ
jgi:hypothetical protein